MFIPPITERKADVIEKLAKLNDVDLGKLQEELVHKWLLDGENAVEGFAAVDLNDVWSALLTASLMSFRLWVQPLLL